MLSFLFGPFVKEEPIDNLFKKLSIFDRHPSHRPDSFTNGNYAGFQQSFICIDSICFVSLVWDVL